MKGGNFAEATGNGKRIKGVKIPEGFGGFSWIMVSHAGRERTLKGGWGGGGWGKRSGLKLCFIGRFMEVWVAPKRGGWGMKSEGNVRQRVEKFFIITKRSTGKKGAVAGGRGESQGKNGRIKGETHHHTPNPIW